MIRSSYKEGNYGAVIEAIVRVQMPSLIVELGVLDGFSTYHFANAAKYLRDHLGRDCEVHAYDLFDKYEFKHGDQKKVQSLLALAGVSKLAKVKKGDAFQVHHHYEDESIDLLHIDISNDGEKIVTLLERWTEKIKKLTGIVLLEGGSKERDLVEWMQKYNRPKIRPAIWSALANYHYYPPMVLERFPSMTILQRKP